MRRSTRIKTEPVDEHPNEESTTPKRKKKSDEQPESSKRAAKQLKAVKTEVPDEVSPKDDKKKKKDEDQPESSKRPARKLKTVKAEPVDELSPKSAERKKGRPATVDSGKKRYIPFPVNDAQDRKDLAEFRKAKKPKDILTVYTTENDLNKFLAGALRAANHELVCPGCPKIFTSYSGIAYHIQRCKESTMEWEQVHDSLVYSDVQARPWMWMNGKKRAKEDMAAAALKESNGSVECVRASSCETPPFTTAAALIAHLNMCCVPTYNQFRGQVDEFRTMEKKTKSALVRLSMTANGGELPCLSCGKIFTHKYGLNYHLERCGFNEDTADLVPWKCYRCGFEGKVTDRHDHLEECEVPPSEALKPQSQRKSMNNMEEEKQGEVKGKKRRNTGVSMAAGLIPESASQTRITTGGLKRFKFRKSEAMQQNITITADLDRYRAAVAAAIEEHEEQNESSSLCAMLQRRAEAQSTPWEKVDEGSYIASLRSKTSIGLRQRTVDDFTQSEAKINSNGKRTTFPPIVEHPCLPAEGNLRRIGAFKAETVESSFSPAVSIGYAGGPIAATLLAPTPLTETSECLAVLTFPDDENLVNTTTGKAHWRATDAYIQLWKVEKTREEKRRKNNDDTREITRCDLSMWFVLRIEGRGLALAANWMPRASDESSALLGYLAVTMSEGSVVIYCIRKDSVPLPSFDAMSEDGEQDVTVVAPPPLLVLEAPTLEEVSELKRTQRQERRGGSGQSNLLLDMMGERLTRSGRTQLETMSLEGSMDGGETTVGGETGEGNGVNGTAFVLPIVRAPDLEDVKPMAGLMIGERENEGVEIVKMPTVAMPETPIRRTKAEQRKELIKMRLVKPEYGPPPQPPLIAVSWSPFGECNSIAAVDAAGTVIVWELREDLLVSDEGEGEGREKREETLQPARIIVDVDWVSPAMNVDWMDDNLLGVSFAERVIRVLDTTTGECQLEENTVRTAGRALMTLGSCFEGLFIYQSEFYTATEAPETAVVYLAYGADKDGYFVVPLTNRHGLMVWAVDVSSSGVIGTSGADGRVQLSMNGKVVPRGCQAAHDLSVNLHTDPLLLIRNRVTEPQAEPFDEDAVEENGAKREKPAPPPAYNTHEEITSKMWLDIVCEEADTVSGPPLPQGLLDSRVESLNAITLSSHSAASPMDHVVVTGGQAGLLFARTCHIEEKGVNSTNWLNIRKWSNPPSKESTPRPRSRASKASTPKEARDD